MASSRVGICIGQHSRCAEIIAITSDRFATTLGLDPDEQRAMDNFAQLCELGRIVGLTVLLEFTPITQIASLDQAMRFLRLTDAPNAGLQLDAYHLFYSNGRRADAQRIDAKWLVSAQLSDGPLAQTLEQYGYNVLFERAPPGFGEMPLVEFVARLPEELPIGVEVPMKSLSDRGIPAVERARLALQAARAVLESASQWSQSSE